MVPAALPFALSFLTIPFVVAGGVHGGWMLALPFLWGWVGLSVLDVVVGRNPANRDPAAAGTGLVWFNLVAWLWVPAQIGLILWCLWIAALPGHLVLWEKIVLMAGLGVATGGPGVAIAHELIHRAGRFERRLGELLLISVAYGHFATEHVYGHHRTVGTPDDPVTARKGEGFWTFLPRAIAGSLLSAWRLDRDRLARRRRPVWHPANPFWRYGLGLAAFLGLAYGLGGWAGIGLFAVQAALAVIQLEAADYVQHYGLTRERLAEGRFERVGLHHSWNTARRVTNYLLINLQRHSDHHAHPERPYPLLQNFAQTEAPRLPDCYPVMILAAWVPPLWFRIMNYRVDRWRERFYAHIEDWRAYDHSGA